MNVASWTHRRCKHQARNTVTASLIIIYSTCCSPAGESKQASREQSVLQSRQWTVDRFGRRQSFLWQTSTLISPDDQPVIQTSARQPNTRIPGGSFLLFLHPPPTHTPPLYCCCRCSCLPACLLLSCSPHPPSDRQDIPRGGISERA